MEATQGPRVRAITACCAASLVATLVGVVPWLFVLVDTVRPPLALLLLYQAVAAGWAVLLAWVVTRPGGRPVLASVPLVVGLLGVVALRAWSRSSMGDVFASRSLVGVVMVGAVFVVVLGVALVVTLGMALGIAAFAVMMRGQLSGEGRSPRAGLAVLASVVATAVLACAWQGAELAPIAAALGLVVLASLSRQWAFVVVGAVVGVVGGGRQVTAFRAEHERLARLAMPMCRDRPFSLRARPVPGVKTVRQRSSSEDVRSGALPVYVMPDGTRPSADVVADVAEALATARCSYGDFDGTTSAARVVLATTRKVDVRLDVQAEQGVDRDALKRALHEELAGVFAAGPELDPENTDGLFRLATPHFDGLSGARSVDLTCPEDDGVYCDWTYVLAKQPGMVPTLGRVDIVVMP